MKLEVEDSLIDTLRLRRKSLGLSQEEVADKLGLSAMGLSYLERGSRELKIEMLELWAKELGLEVEVTLSSPQDHVHESSNLMCLVYHTHGRQCNKCKNCGKYY